MIKFRYLFWTGWMVLLAAPAAQAHPNHELQGFMGGAVHPVVGWDHLLAMVAVGLWATQLGGPAPWILPATFLTSMGLGGFFGVNGIPLPLVESGILVSVIVLGLLIATSKRLPLIPSIALVGLFAIFHGYAHGTEIVPGSPALAYGVGFAVTTAGLHLLGICLGRFLKKFTSSNPLKTCGAAITFSSLLL